jgi:anti-anti-sigma factor
MVVTTRSKPLPLEIPHFQTTYFKEALLVQIPPRLSVVEALAFRNTIQDWVQQDPAPNKIILDFSQTTLMDSSGIGGVLSALKAARAKKIPLILWSLNAQVNLAFSLAGLDQLLTIEAHTEAIIPIDTRTQAQPSSLLHPSVRSPLKRAIDITSALIGLCVMGLVLLPIAIVLKLDSPGPIFVGQQRCGLMGRRFYLWSFRVRGATAGYPPQGTFAQKENDPSMTSVGQFLHKTSLDALPQFWNVLKGELSLIGPRPATLDELDQYEIDSWKCLDVKPGLMGALQISEQPKSHRNEDIIQLDLHYQENWSLQYDLKLILKRCVWFL